MKKRQWTVRTALCALLLALCAACALGEDAGTPRKGLAVAAPAQETGAVPLFEKASEDSPVLMEYYAGTLLEVVSFAGGGMVKVQCGEKGASVMGYMREGDLRYGAQAMRETPHCVMKVTLQRETAVRGYPDEQAAELARLAEAEVFFAASRNEEKWVQLSVEPCFFNYERERFDSVYDHGFVHIPIGTATGEFVREDGYNVLPVEGELDAQAAYERGIELTLQNQRVLVRDFPQGITEEDVRSMHCQWWLVYNSRTGESFWNLSFFDPQNVERDIGIQMTGQGELLQIALSNG